MRSSDSDRAPKPARRSWPSMLVGPGFVLLAAWLLFGPDTVELPSGEPKPLAAGLISFEPRREILGDPPTIEVEGSPRTCSECHTLFAPAVETPGDLAVHGHIRLDHGINDRCRNCHHVQDRDKLVLHDGRVIRFEDSPILCAKCHGPTYRDWEVGAHGRSNGYWDTSRGTMRRLKCSQCHDPHNPRRPAMDPIAPLPAPREPHAARGHVAAGHGSGEGHGSGSEPSHEGEQDHDSGGGGTPHESPETTESPTDGHGDAPEPGLESTEAPEATEGLGGTEGLEAEESPVESLEAAAEEGRKEGAE